MANYSTELDATFHALADPTRRAVIVRLVEGSATVKELAEPFPMGLPSFLKHLKVLEESDLIKSEKIGRVRTCSIQPKQLAEVEAWLLQQRRRWESRLDTFADYVEALARSEENHD